MTSFLFMKRLPALVILLASAGPASAQLGNKPVEVVNPPGGSLDVTVGNFPASQTVNGTVNVGNFPATQAVSGTVGVNNFPATQTVNGTVNVGNFPATQPVSGTVSVGNVVAVAPEEGTSHLGQPIEAHFKMTVSSTPLLLNFGLIRFQEEGPGGGSSTPEIAADECMVVLDIELTFQTIVEIAPSTIADEPFGVAAFEYGLTDGTNFFRMGELNALANEGSYGQLQRSFGGGLVVRRSGFAPGSNEFAMMSVSPGLSGLEVYPRMLGGHATGYRIPC